MASSQEPVEYVDPPQAVLDLAVANPAVTLNLRPDHWSEAEVESFKGDSLRKIRAGMYYGVFMSRPLTDFLVKLAAGTKLATCVQDAQGKIEFVLGTVKEVFWIDHRGGTRKAEDVYSVHVAIRFLEDERGALTPAWQVWGNYVLAIAEVSEEAPVTKQRPDPKGLRFVRLVKRFGVSTEHLP